MKSKLHHLHPQVKHHRYLMIYFTFFSSSFKSLVLVYLFKKLLHHPSSSCKLSKSNLSRCTEYTQGQTDRQTERDMHIVHIEHFAMDVNFSQVKLDIQRLKICCSLSHIFVEERKRKRKRVKRMTKKILQHMRHI